MLPSLILIVYVFSLSMGKAWPGAHVFPATYFSVAYLLILVPVGLGLGFCVLESVSHRFVISVQCS